MICKPILSLTLFVIACCLHLSSFAQQAHWLQGLWQHHSIYPDTLQGRSIKSDLLITSADGNNYTGIQRVYLTADSSLNVKMHCSGTLVKGNISFVPGDRIRVSETPGMPFWAAIVNVNVSKSYFSISRQQLVWHIEMKEKPGMISRFSYYRDLDGYDEATRLMLVKRYGSPQILDDLVPIYCP